MKTCLISPWLAVVVLTGSLASAEPPAASSRVLEAGKLPADARLKPARNLNDAYHPWNPPADKAAWEREATAIRERVLVSNGLWPLPPAAPLQPVITGKIDRDDYTIEKVYFASLPGHYVTGNLYRPKKINGKAAGVLCPHGHWQNGRFYDAGEGGAKEQITQGAEKFDAGARYPLQARMVGLARMGCIVFHYDMVGYADSQAIEHRSGFNDVESELRLQNKMGLQTFNSLAALNYLASLPEVDDSRIGVTGASGGGTQTFMLCAIDPRPAVAFPAVMVSTAMQGGCVCENASYLRIGINNISLAALFAPKPLAMSGADDWTIDIETKGLPELRKVYGLYGESDLVQAKTYAQFKHNYNQVAREMMYNWFNKQLNLGQKEPVAERDFKPVPPTELAVFGGDKKPPSDVADVQKLRNDLTKTAAEQWAALMADESSDSAEYRRVVSAAARVMLDPGVTSKEQLEIREVGKGTVGEHTLHKLTLGRKGAGEEIPTIVIIPKEAGDTAVVWADSRGKAALFTSDGKLIPAAEKLLASGRSIVAADLFLTGEFLADGQAPAQAAVDKNFAGYTFGYNRPLLSNRVRDLLTVISATAQHEDVKKVQLLGTGEAGVWALLARALAGDKVARTVVDVKGFSFSKVKDVTDPMMLPGALKYGGLGGLAALAAPAELTVAGIKDMDPQELAPLTGIYEKSRGELNLEESALTPDAAVERLLK